MTLQDFPSKSEIREAYVMKNYSKISLDELQSNSIFVSKSVDNFNKTDFSVKVKEKFHNFCEEFQNFCENIKRKKYLIF